MSGIAEIMKAVKELDPADFLRLRSALDQAEERLWSRELGRVSAKHRNSKLTDARIDELVLRRRSKGRP
jgi:hypothetical protein